MVDLITIRKLKSKESFKMLIPKQNGCLTNEKYTVQLVLQHIALGESLFRLYGDVMEMVPVHEFDVSMTLMDNEKKLVKMSSYVLNTSDKLSNHMYIDGVDAGSMTKQKAMPIRVHPMGSPEHRLRIGRNTLAQFEIEAPQLSAIKLKMNLRPASIVGDGDSEEALLSEESGYYATFVGTQFMHKFEAPQKTLIAPVIDKSFNFAGELSVEYTVIRPWQRTAEFNEKLECFSLKDSRKRPLLVGHRGSGVTFSPNPSEYMENSIKSFLAAFECGADFVELDVQMTCDDKIVVYHDNSTCLVLPNEFFGSSTLPGNSVGTVPATHRRMEHNASVLDDLDSSSVGEPGVVDEELSGVGSSRGFHRRRDSSASSCSTTGSVSSLSVAIRYLNVDQLKSHKFVSQKNCENAPITRSSTTRPHQHDEDKININNQTPIGNPFPTLAEVLSELPKNLGVNIEIKSPQERRNGVWENDFGKNYDRNKLIDLILEVILDAKDSQRPIVFSSFDPWICSMLRKKQNRYPVLFLIETKPSHMQECNDNRLATIDGAVLFAKGEGLDGIVSCVDFILDKIKKVTKIVKSQGLYFFTYGEKNNVLENVIKQVEASVDGIISDRLKYIIPQLDEYKLRSPNSTI